MKCSTDQGRRGTQTLPPDKATISLCLWSGHKYLTLAYQIDLGVTRLLWVGKERTIKFFQRFLTTMGEEITSKIVCVCSDMWEPYLKVIRE